MLRTDEIALAPLTAADVPLLFEWINDRALRVQGASYRPVHEAQHRAWFDAIASRTDLALFAIRRVHEGDLIGTCQLERIHPVYRSAELQVRIGLPEHRGRGYGPQAVRLLLQFAFADLNLHRVSLHVFADNAAAVRCYEKAGFVREGLLRQAAFVDGKWKDIVLMGILRPGGHDG
jgi:RimJ/RimL family protein N-acetyltransferase